MGAGLEPAAYEHVLCRVVVQLVLVACADTWFNYLRAAVGARSFRPACPCDKVTHVVPA